MRPHVTDPWNLSTIRRLEILLSSRKPILCSHHVYEKKRSGFFDMHYGVELGVVVSGRMKRFYRGHETNPGAGEVWMCGMWEPHGFEVATDRCEVVVLVIWPPMLATQRFEESPGLNWLNPFVVRPADRPRVDPKRRRAVLEVARKAIGIREHPGEYDQLRLRMIVMEILLLACEGWTPSEHLENNPTDAFSRVNRALVSVFESRRNVTVQEAAKMCGMGRNMFARVFKGLMGIGFPDFVLRYRLNGAAAQLLSTRDPIKAVADEWGFTDASHLHRCFLEAYGCSPGEYRKKAGK